MFPLLVPDAQSRLPFTLAVVMAGVVAITLTATTRAQLGWESPGG